MRKLWLILGLALSLSGGAIAQIGSHLKEEFQDAEKHGIRIVERVSEVRGVIHDPAVRILCMQTFGEEIAPDLQSEILDWVRSGKTVWYYDARLAPQFGMKPYFLEAEQFRSKPEKGVLGAEKHTGLATVGISFGQHAVQTGVGQVTVFLPDIAKPGDGEEGKLYGALEVTGDTLPLLQFALDSPALMALRREGRGLIVFKTLLWNEALSGDRFQYNLLDYSAGFQVPGPAGVGKVGNPPGPEADFVTGSPAVPIEVAGASSGLAPAATASPAATKEPGRVATAGAWSLELKDGTVVVGDLQGDMLQFETGTGSLKLKPEDIVMLEFGSSVKLDKLTTSKGKTESGLFLSSPLKFRTDRGVEEFEKEDLQLLQRSEVTPKEKMTP